MHGRDMTRIMIEGALNGIRFVIGSAIVGWIVSFFFLHIWAFFALPIICLVLWLGLKGRRLLKARLERVKVDEFARALRSSAVGGREPCARRTRRKKGRGRKRQNRESKHKIK